MLLAMKFLLPFMLAGGVLLHWAVFVSLWMPVIIMSAAVLYLWKKSGKSFSEFFYAKKLCRKCLSVTILAFIVVQVGELALAPTREFLGSLPFMDAPASYPEIFKPDYIINLPLRSFMGMSVSGNYGVIFFWALWIIVNIGGEELLWRGYALPRMEKYFGKWAWLVNGLLWNLVVHSFMCWSWIALMPVSLIVPFLSQQTKSLWPGIIIHGLGNLLIYLVLIPSI